MELRIEYTTGEYLNMGFCGQWVQCQYISTDSIDSYIYQNRPLHMDIDEDIAKYIKSIEIIDIDEKLLSYESLVDIKHCYRCLCEIDIDDDAYVLLGKHICADCFLEHYALCTSCDSVYEIEDMEDVDGDMYCSDCFDRHYVRCNSCDNVISRGNEIEQDRNNYCSDCFDELYTSCDMCDTTISRNDCYSNDDGVYCEDCYESVREEERGDYNWIHSYSYKPAPVFKGESGPYMGIELEIEFGKDTDIDNVENHLYNYDYLYYKEDGSLSHGVEIVSHPFTLKYHQEYSWEQLLQGLRQNGCKSHDVNTCGLHVHISKDFLRKVEQLKLAVFANRCNSYIHKIGRREYNHYCEQPEFRDKIRACVNNGRLTSPCRYEAINFQNYDTVEFRFFKGTLRYESFMSSIEFVDAVCRWVKTLSTNYLILHDVSEIEKSLSSWIYKNRKSYICLYEYMVEKGLIEKPITKIRKEANNVYNSLQAG